MSGLAAGRVAPSGASSSRSEALINAQAIHEVKIQKKFEKPLSSISTPIVGMRLMHFCSAFNNVTVQYM